MLAYDINYDTDGKEIDDLPEELPIPPWITDEDEISDYISDETEFCHEGFALKNPVLVVTRNEDDKTYLGRITEDGETCDVVFYKVPAEHLYTLIKRETDKGAVAVFKDRDELYLRELSKKGE